MTPENKSSLQSSGLKEHCPCQFKQSVLRKKIEINNNNIQ